MNKSFDYHIFIPVGGVHENKENIGISHLLEHLVFDYGSREDLTNFVSFLEKNNIEDDAEIHELYTHVYFLGLNKKLLSKIKDYWSLILGINFNEERFLKHKKILKEEVSYRNQQINSLIDNLFLSLIFKGNHFSNPVIGKKNTIESIELNEVKKWFNLYYKNKVEIIFDKNKGLLDIKPDKLKTVLEVPVLDNKNMEFEKDLKLESAGLEFGWFYKTKSQKERVILDVIARILGGMSSSFIYNNIISKKSLAYKGGSYIQHFKGGSLLSCLIFSTQPDKVLKEFKNYFDKLINKNDIEVEIFNKALDLEKNYFSSYDVSLPNVIGEEFLNTGELYIPKERVSIINKINKKEVEEVMFKILKNNFFKVVVK